MMWAGTRGGTVTLGRRCPRAARGALLAEIAEVAGATALTYGVTITDGGPRMTTWQMHGDAWVGDMMPVLAANPDIWPRATRSALLAPPPRETRGFFEIDALFDRRQLEKSRIGQELFHPFRMGDQLRLIAVQGDRILGWIGAVARDRQRFGRRDRQRMRRLIEKSVTVLAAARALEKLEVPSREAFVLVRPDGRIAHASPLGRTWLARPGFRDALMRAVAVADRDAESETSEVMDLAHARLVRLDDESHSLYLACVRPAPEARVPPIVALTPTRREIAQLAAAGATVHEIARHLGRSENTVRSHLKAIYATLGVSRRIELAERLSLMTT